MPYATNGRVSSTPIEGGIEISRSQYKASVAAMTRGEQVAVIDGQMVLRSKPPSPKHTWENGAWVEPEVAPKPTTVDDVKAAAQRRILAIMPVHKQRNSLALFAEASQTYGVDASGWPDDLQEANAAAMVQWQAIKAIRARSDEIEDMDPIPEKISDDELWASSDE